MFTPFQAPFTHMHYNHTVSPFPINGNGTSKPSHRHFPVISRAPEINSHQYGKVGGGDNQDPNNAQLGVTVLYSHIEVMLLTNS